MDTINWKTYSARKCVSNLILFFILIASHATGTLAQNVFQQKDLVFPQVVVGENFDSVITLTNRGTFAYSGTMFLRSGNSAVWSPLVNGETAENGEVAISIEPDQTITLRLSGGELTPGTATLVSDDLVLDNFVEGNLTYFVREGGKVIDSVGIGPSQEFYLASIPFEEFSTIGLALTSVDLTGLNTAQVQLNLLTDDGFLLDSRNIELAPFEHNPQFLREIFPGLQLSRGKVEIASALPIVGVAITVKNKQLSSLPLQPSPVTYAVRMVDSDSTVYTGTAALWAEGFFMRGYFIISDYQEEGMSEPVVIENPSLNLLNGQLFTEGESPTLRLSFYVFSNAFFGEPATIYFQHPSFSIFDELVSGTWTLLFLSDKASMEGTFEFNRTSP